MDMYENETVVEQATYRGVMIFATSFNFCIVEYAGMYYRCDNLGEAKEMIDSLKDSRKN